MNASPDEVSVRAWKPPVPGVREVLHAQFADHAYPPHTHDAWTLFIVDAGSVRYDLDRHERGAEPSMVSLLPPHVVHDGRPGKTTGGYRKRVIYLEPDVLGEALIGRAVDRPAIADPGLRRRLSAVHDALGCIDDALEAETRLAFVTERIRQAYGSTDVASRVRPDDLAEALRAYLDERATEAVTMADAAAVVGASPTRLTRAFEAAFGIAPHAYVLARRLDIARDRILDGRPLAEVAAEVGFFDQAHLTRRFKRFFGVTPGRFASDPSRP
jgi:AraC-like DNA-binding protein